MKKIMKICFKQIQCVQQKTTKKIQQKQKKTVMPKEYLIKFEELR